MIKKRFAFREKMIGTINEIDAERRNKYITPAEIRVFLFKQKLLGLILLICSMVLIIGEVLLSPKFSCDLTVLIFMIPLGLYLLFTKKLIADF